MTRLRTVLFHAVSTCTCAATASAQGADPSCGTWEVVPTPMPANADRAIIRDIVAIADDDVWAAGHQRTQRFGGFRGMHILAMHYDGSSWTVMDTPILGGGRHESTSASRFALTRLTLTTVLQFNEGVSNVRILRRTTRYRSR